MSRTRLLVLVLVSLVVFGPRTSTATPPATEFEDRPALLVPESDRALFAERFSAPFRFGAIGVLAAGGLSSVLTEDLESPEQEVGFLEHRTLERTSDIGNFFGAGEVTIVPAVLLWSVGSVTDSRAVTDFGRDLTATFLATGTYTWLLKSAARRPRPSGGSFSFPSGHTAVAFGTATVVHRHLGWKAGTLAYIAATCTAAARMEDNRHYFSDVSFGAALGLAVGGVRLPYGWWDGLRERMDVGPRGVSVQVDF